jgi:Rv2175c C-terminal domain of unknown function
VTENNVATLDALVPEWLPVPDVAERLGLSVTQVKTMIRERELVALPYGERGAPHVPAAFVVGGEVVKGLAGTLTVLNDAGYDAEESVRWLFTEADALDATPIAALTANRRKHVHREAQLLGF